MLAYFDVGFIDLEQNSQLIHALYIDYLSIPKRQRLYR